MVRELSKVPLETRGSNLMLSYGLIKFYTSIIRLNRLSDLLGLAQQKALLKLLMKTFVQKCILNAECNVHSCAVETECFRKNSAKREFQTNC